MSEHPSPPTSDEPAAVGRRRLAEWRTPAGRRLADRHRRLARRVGRRGALAASLAVGGGVALVSVGAVALIADAVTDRDGIARWDRPALAVAKRLRGPVTDAAAASIARVFGPQIMPVWAAAVGVAMSVRQRDSAPLILIAASGIGAVGMTIAGKRIVDRPRPSHRDAIPPYEYSPSFPSGHTLNATAVLGTIAYLAMVHQRRQAPQAVTVAAAGGASAVVGLSRVLLGAHWFTDVAAGWVSGAGWLAAVITSHRLAVTLDEDPAG